jgi:hypothetical protein
MRVLRRLRQSTFFRGVLAIAGGTALAQVAGVLFLPLLTRLYSPEALGLWGLFVSFLGVASVAATLRYEVAIVAASSEEEALALTRSTLALAIVMGFLGVPGLRRPHRNSLGNGSSLLCRAPGCFRAGGTLYGGSRSDQTCESDFAVLCWCWRPSFGRDCRPLLGSHRPVARLTPGFWFLVAPGCSS